MKSACGIKYTEFNRGQKYEIRGICINFVVTTGIPGCCIAYRRPGQPAPIIRTRRRRERRRPAGARRAPAGYTLPMRFRNVHIDIPTNGFSGYTEEAAEKPSSEHAVQNSTMSGNGSRGYLMVLLFLTVAAVLLALCITTGGTDDRSRVTITSSDGDTHEGYINVTGGRVWFRVAGANSPGTPLLVLHGGPGVPHDYLEPLEALADERPIVFYDQLGCGNSDHPDDPALWTVERYIQEVGEVRDALGLERIHLLGQSWGGALATSYVLDAKPGGVESLILSAPLLDANRWAADQRANLAAFPDEMQAAVREAETTGNFDAPDYQEAMGAYYARHVCRLDPWPECLNRSLERLAMPIYLRMWGPSEFTCTGTLQTFNVTDRLAEIQVPVLFTCGEHDEALPATMAYFQSRVPGSELKVFEGASHSHHLEETDAYLQVVQEFLRRVDATS